MPLLNSLVISQRQSKGILEEVARRNSAQDIEYALLVCAMVGVLLTAIIISLLCTMKSRCHGQYRRAREAPPAYTPPQAPIVHTEERRPLFSRTDFPTFRSPFNQKLEMPTLGKISQPANKE